MLADPAEAEAESEAPAEGIGGAGAAVIRRQLKNAPNAPGVYRMIAANGDVLYVGKARNIRARIAAYARGQAHTNRIARMIAETASMEFVTTGTETEALLLEANLIKQLKPRYNVLLRDDKSFPYILVTKDHVSPQITKHRGARNRPGRLLRPLRQRLGREPHLERLAARLPVAVLLGFLLREPHAALPPVPDQALRRALHGRGEPHGLCRTRRRGARFPVRQEPRRARSGSAPRCSRPPTRSNSSARRGCATASRRSRPSRRARTSTRNRPRRPMSSRSLARPAMSASRRSSSAPSRTGATAPIFRRPTRP